MSGNQDAARQEVVFLFGQHAMDKALDRGPEYFVRKVDMIQLRWAVRTLRNRTGSERARFARTLAPEVAGAMIHAMLDSQTWDRLVLEHALSKVPDDKPARRKGSRTRLVRRRRIRASSLDQDQEG